MASKRKNKRRRAKRSPPPPAAGGEDRRSAAVTVAWMMTLLTTMAFLALSAAAAWLFPASLPGNPPGPWSFFSSLLFFVALVTGTLCLLMTVAVYWFRRTPPPWAITVAAILVSLAPWLSLLLSGR